VVYQGSLNTIRLHSRSKVRQKSLLDHTFDDPLWVSGEFWDQINVAKGLRLFIMVYDLVNYIVGQHSWRVRRQGDSEGPIQYQNEIDDVGCQKLCRRGAISWEV